MNIGDKVVNTVTGNNIKTIRVNCSQMAEIIFGCFGSGGMSVEHIFNMLKGKFFAWTEEDSPDGKYHLHISHFRRSLTVHRIVWVKCYETEEIFEWRGYTLGSLRREFSRRVEAECSAGSIEAIYELMKKQRKKGRVFIFGGVVALVLIIGMSVRILYSNKIVADADQQMAIGNYNIAYELYEKAGRYADTESVMNCLYMMVREYCDKGDLDSFYEAQSLCEKMTGEKRKEALNLIREKKYNSAIAYYNEGLYEDARKFFNGISDDYKEKTMYLEKISGIEQVIGHIYGTYFKKDSSITLIKAEKESEKALAIGVFTVISCKKTENGIELELRDYSTRKKTQAVYYNDYSVAVFKKKSLTQTHCVYLKSYDRNGKNYNGYYLEDEKLAALLQL